MQSTHLLAGRKLLAIVFSVGLIMFGVKLAHSAASMPSAGQTAPDFTLPSQDGSNISLNQFKGRWVVLYFYPKDGTPGCTMEAHNFQRDLAKFQNDNAVIIGVSLDSPDSHKNFCTRQGLTFKLLADTQQKVTQEYGSLSSLFGFKMAARNTFLIDPSGRIAKVWTGVNPGGHSEQVLATLQKLSNK